MTSKAPLSDTESTPSDYFWDPMGAVKEQSAYLYAQIMAERGFVTLSSIVFQGRE